MRRSRSQCFRLKNPSFSRGLSDNRRYSAAAVRLSKHLPMPVPEETRQESWIAPSVLANAITDPWSLQHDRLTVVDCRYQYQYNACRIVGAINIPSFREFQEMRHQFQLPNTLYVFYSENSKERAPTVRSLFQESLQHCKGCNFVLLQGGMKEFFSLHPSLCAGHYIPRLGSSDSMLGVARSRGSPVSSTNKFTRRTGKKDGKISAILPLFGKKPACGEPH